MLITCFFFHFRPLYKIHFQSLLIIYPECVSVKKFSHSVAHLLANDSLCRDDDGSCRYRQCLVLVGSDIPSTDSGRMHITSDTELAIVQDITS